MNLELFQLEPIEIYRFQLKEVIRCIVHTILFQRSLGHLTQWTSQHGEASTTRDVDCDIFHISYPQVQGCCAQVERALDEFMQHVQQQQEMGRPAAEDVHQPSSSSERNVFSTKCVLTFYRRKIVSSFWFSKKEEKFYWERWEIPITVVVERGQGSSFVLQQRASAGK